MIESIEINQKIMYDIAGFTQVFGKALNHLERH